MTVMIRVYPNKFDRQQWQPYTFPAGQSLTDILVAQVPNFRVMASPPIQVVRNGEVFLPAVWDTPLKAGDRLDIEVQPKGIELIVGGIIAAAVGYAVASSMAPPDNYTKTTPDGSPIYDTNAQGNQVRLMGIIPEVFGTQATYPSLINQPHRYFFDDDEYLLMMVLVSRGFVQLGSDRIFVGNTPITHYSGDIDSALFDPGEDVTSHPAHVNTYTSPEVGSTSGTSGIELKGAVTSVTADTARVNDQSLVMLRNIEGIQSSFWPEEWLIGSTIKISGTPGAEEIQAGDAYAGWRREADADILNYWSTNPDLHLCQLGDYVQYPAAVSPVNGYITRWDTGMVAAKLIGYQNGKEFYAIRVVDAHGDVLPVSAVPVDARDSEVKFLPDDDGFYRVEAVDGQQATMRKLTPDGELDNPWWLAFYWQGDNQGWTLETTDGLPGTPVGPYYACPENELTDEIHVDIKHPEGLGYLEDNGNISPRLMQLRIEWRADGEMEWEGIDWQREAATKDQLGNTLKIKLGRFIRPQVRAYRISGEVDDTRTWDKVELVRLKAVLTTPHQYRDGTTLALRIRGTNVLSKSAENRLMCIPTRLLHVPDGKGGWTGNDYTLRAGMQPTEDIVPVARYITHEVGHTDEQLPGMEWLALHGVLSQRSDRFCAQFDNSDTFWAALKRVLAPGFAVPTMEHGQIIPVRDQLRTIPDQIFTPDNMAGNGLKMHVKGEDNDDKDGVEVEYFSEITHKPETVLCLLPGDRAIKPKKVKAFGVTDRQKAWVFGMRERRMMKYIHTRFTWSTEMDGFNARYLGYAAVSDDVPGFGQTGVLVDFVPVAGGLMLQLDDDLVWEDDQPHYLALRRPDGSLSGPFRAMRQPYLDEVKIVLGPDQTLDFTPVLDGSMEPPYWMFGPGESWCFHTLIRDIRPSGTDKVNLEARNYDARLYLDDDAIAPPRDGDPVLGLACLASGTGATLQTNVSMLTFRPGDQLRLNVTETEYRVTAVASTSLTLALLDNTPAELALANQPITLTLTARP